MYRSGNNLVFLTSRRRFRAVVLLALLLAAAVAISSAQRPTALAGSAQLGQTPPPGPILESGDFIRTDNRTITAGWEEYSGGMLLVWDTTYVSQAYSGACAFAGGIICYKWIQYAYSPADAYNSSLWTPFQRGCLVLGADPLQIGEADGYEVVTDTWAAGQTYIPVSRQLFGVGTFNYDSAGTASAPAQSSLPSPWTYDSCYGGGGTGGCTQWNVAGPWQTTQNGSLPVYFTFQQTGTTVTGTAAAPSQNLNGSVSGTLNGNQLNVVVTWSPTLQGAYQGTVSSGEITNGTTYQVGSPPSSGVSWIGSGTTSCSSGGQPNPTPGGCTQWSVNGDWQTIQNGNLSVNFTFHQSGTALDGKASAPSLNLNGTLTGTLFGDQLSVTVTWNATTQGNYQGTVTTGKIINGKTYQVGRSPGSSVSWSGTGPAACTTPGTPSTPGASTSCDWNGTWVDGNGVRPNLVLKLSGNAITGTFGDIGNVRGTINGDLMTGTVTGPSGQSLAIELRIGYEIDSFGGQYVPARLGCRVMAGKFLYEPVNFDRLS